MILGADTEREIVELLLVEAERIKPARITGIGQDGWRKRQQPIDEAVFVLLGALELLVFMRVPRAQRYTEPVGDQLDIVVRIDRIRSEEHTSELQSLMRISYAVFCLKKKKT